MSTLPARLPRAGDSLATGAFSQLARVAGRGPGAALVATALNQAGVSGGHLVVPDLPDPPQARSRILARIITYQHAAVETDWTHLAYAIVAFDDHRQAALAVIERIAREHP